MASPEPVESQVSTRGPRRRSLLVCALAVLIALGAAEVVLQALDLPRAEQGMPFLGGLFEEESFVEDPELFWRLRKGSTTYQANRVGLRGYWPYVSKSERAFHVVCVGDSCTFGGVVRLEDTYGHRLERLLQDALPGRSVAAILAALPGYTSHQNRLLLDKHGAFLAPDLTVLYCGGWNDYVPAIGLSDAARSAQQTGLLTRLRLGRLIQHATAGSTAPRQDYVQAMSEGRAPDGRRVPVAQFRDNLRAMLLRGRASGGMVLAVLPPLPVATMRDYPIALEHARAVRDVMAQQGVQLVDGPKLFAKFEAACPKPWRKPMPNGSLCFADWVHPTAVGHGLLADALFALLEPQLPELQPPQIEAPRLVDLGLGPSGPIHALRGATVEVKVPGLTDGETVERVRVGHHWVPAEARGDRLVLQLPARLIPGAHPLRIQTNKAWLHGRNPVRVLGAAIRAQLQKQPGAVELSIEAELPPGWRAGFWLGTELRAAPTPTHYGPFHLKADPDGAYPDRPELPFLFDRLKLPGYIADVDEEGKLELKQRIELGANTALPEVVYLQGGIYDPGQPWFGALTEVVELMLPR